MAIEKGRLLMKLNRFGISVLIASLFLSLAVFSACRGKKPAADLVLLNGKVVTLDPAIPQAEALAVVGEKIAAVGRSKDIKAYIGASTKVVDLQGNLAVPGLIDSHLHFSGVGEAKAILDLTGAKNWDEVVSLVQAAVQRASPGEWILGRGWHQEKWDSVPEPSVDGLPFHHRLSAVSPENPVLLTHASGHSCLANAKAMELAGISKKTSDPPGGEIVRDGSGLPIGAFRETAQGLVRRALASDRQKRSPEQIREEERRSVARAAKECLAKGITSVHDAGVSFETIDLYKSLAEEGKLGVRIYAMIGVGNEVLARRINEYKIIAAGNHHLTVRSIKRLMDGALGAHGAWLLEPYNDLPTSSGLNTMSVEALKETARLAIENDFQLCTHAIGDRANREVLNVYQEVFAAHPGKKDLRWRIEHAQHLHPDDIPRFGRLGVVAAMQGIHCSSDGPWVVKKLGEERARTGAYVWRELLETGAVIANGTDAPVEDVDPIACFYASVTRKMNTGEDFFPDQRMTREEALRSYTINGAYAAFQEDILGSLSPGKLADITVFSRDILTVPEDQIPETTVVYTMLGGKILYQKLADKAEYFFAFED